MGTVRESSVKWALAASTLLMTTPLAGQGYGQSLAVGDDEVIVGESLSESSPGYAYVFRKDSGGAWEIGRAHV